MTPEGGADTRPTVVVVGAGLAGLAVAFELDERAQRILGGVDIVCFEASERAGGTIRTSREEGYLCEWGPTGLLEDAPHTRTLVRRLGLQDRLIRAKPTGLDRYVLRNGRLRRLPTRLRGLLRSRALPFGATLRALGEPWISSRTGSVDESVFEFASRRLGARAAAMLVQPLVAESCGGDARQLSARAAFPELHRAVSEGGGLLRAILGGGHAGEKTAAPTTLPGSPRALASFRNGMQELTDRLASALGDKLHVDSPITAIHDLGRRGFRVHRREGAPLDVAAVVLSSSARVSSELVVELDAELSRILEAIPTAPIGVIHLGYRGSDLGDRPEGFGFLAPRDQGIRILGTSWVSDVFDGRAPEGRVLMTSTAGGTHDPGAVGLSNSQLLELVRRDLGSAMGITATPAFGAVLRHPHGIPQYDLDHPERMKRIDERLREHPGLFLGGWSYRGISVDACIRDSAEVAETVLSRLGATV